MITGKNTELSTDSYWLYVTVLGSNAKKKEHISIYLRKNISGGKQFLS